MSVPIDIEGSDRPGIRPLLPARGPFRLRDLPGRREPLLLVLLVLVMAVFGSLSPYFLDAMNLADGTQAFSEKAIVALPMAFLILCREVDLSVAAIMALSSVAMGHAASLGADAATLAAIGIGVGLAAGLVNGVIVTWCRVPSLVVTIGTMSLYRGIGSVVLGDGAYTSYPAGFADLGSTYLGGVVPATFVLFLALALVFAVVLHATTFGRRLYALGSNPIAARFSGVPVDGIRLFLFTLTGTLSGLAGVLLTARIGSTRPNIAQGWELEIITMVVLGGVSIAGGSGTIPGVVLAVLVLGMVTFGLGLLNIPGIVMSIFLGTLLILAIAGPILFARLGGGPRRR